MTKYYMREFFILGILGVAGYITITQMFFVTPETRDEKRRIRAQHEKEKTKEYLEQSARAEIDYLSQKYDIEILQDQLNKNKKEAKK